jgi:uncharacterized coiled-coil DUF342 family protein
MARDIDSLKRSMQACLENIRHIKAARKVEQKTAKSYQQQIRDLKSGASTQYTVEGLEHGIERTQINLSNLDAANKRERDAIKRFKAMVDSIHLAEAKKAEAMAGVSIEIVH